MNIQNPRKRTDQEGFTLVELMIVVAIIGILAVLAIFGVTKYVQNAKTGEARNALGQVAKAAVAAYEQERAPATLLAAGKATESTVHQFCDKADKTVPATAGDVQDKKYQSTMEAGKDWSAGTALAGWTCLKFSLTEPQYFQYGYFGKPAEGFNGYAAGYLSNGTTPTHGFSLGGKLVGTAGNAQVVVQPQIEETAGAPATTDALPAGG